MGRAERLRYYPLRLRLVIGPLFCKPQSEEPWQVPDQHLAIAESQEVISRREVRTNLPGRQASRPTRRNAVGRAEPT